MPEQYIKSEAPANFISAIQEIEDRADECHKDLAALHVPKNLMAWAVLARTVERIEREIADSGYGSPAQIAVMLNLSRATSQVLDWIRKADTKPFVPRRELKWSPQLAAVADQALFVAVRYAAFTSNFPLWHKNLMRAEIVSSSTVKFMGLGDENELRVRAHQQGLRPHGSRPVRGSSLQFEASVEGEVKRRILNLVQNGSKSEGPLSFSYGKPKRLWQLLYSAQLEAMNALFRRNEALDLGGYAIGDFKRFYAGLLAVCSVHENACDLRGQMQQKYPVDSVVVVQRQNHWNEILSEITSLEQDKVEPMIRDLTFGATAVKDLYVHPFIPLSADSKDLGLVPHFVLNSRADENVVRACSHLRPEIHGPIAQAKEDEMRGQLITSSRPGLCWRGPRLLPPPLPDIDLIIEEASSSCVVIAELKWLRKTIRPTEHSVQRQEFLHGVEQLTQIRGFLETNPLFLKDRGDITQDLRDVDYLHYALIARDYFVWVDPATGYQVIDYEQFLGAITKIPGSLVEQVRGLLKFEWLPHEGTDFRASYDRQMIGDVSVVSQILHANY